MVLHSVFDNPEKMFTATEKVYTPSLSQIGTRNMKKRYKKEPTQAPRGCNHHFGLWI